MRTSLASELVEQNTKLTQSSQELTEGIKRLTDEIHRKVTRGLDPNVAADEPDRRRVGLEGGEEVVDGHRPGSTTVALQRPARDPQQQGNPPPAILGRSRRGLSFPMQPRGQVGLRA